MSEGERAPTTWRRRVAVICTMAFVLHTLTLGVLVVWADLSECLGQWDACYPAERCLQPDPTTPIESDIVAASLRIHLAVALGPPRLAAVRSAS